MKKLSFSLLSAMSIISVCYADDVHHAIIVDAGSSGSRLHLYEYSQNQNLPLIKEIFTESVKPGLSSYANHPEQAGESLKKLFDDANTFIQVNHIAPQTIPVRVLATAGMRLLPEDIQNLIYVNINQYLAIHYDFPIKQVATITGKIEGLYAWLDVNYLGKNFQENKPSVGTLNMGGASTQIVFETADAMQAEDEVDIKINDKNYRVFSKSFLGLGFDQVSATMNQSADANTCYPSAYPMQNQTGNFNAATCSKIYADIVKGHHVQENLPATTHHQFIATDGFYYTYHFFNADKNPDQKIIEADVQSVCYQSWDDLQKAYPSEAPKYLANYCGYQLYIDQLFYEYYQLNGSQLILEPSINNQTIDWSEGALFYQILKNE